MTLFFPLEVILEPRADLSPSAELLLANYYQQLRNSYLDSGIRVFMAESHLDLHCPKGRKF